MLVPNDDLFEKETNFALLSSMQDNIQQLLFELQNYMDSLNSPILKILNNILNTSEHLKTECLTNLKKIRSLNEKVKLQMENLNLDGGNILSITSKKIKEIESELSKFNFTYEKKKGNYEDYRNKINQLFHLEEESENLNTMLQYFENFDHNLENNIFEITPVKEKQEIELNPVERFSVLNQEVSSVGSPLLSIKSSEYEDINNSENDTQKKRKREKQKKFNQKREKIIESIKEAFPQHKSRMTYHFLRNLQKIKRIQNYIAHGDPNNCVPSLKSSGGFTNVKLVLEINELNQQEVTDILYFLKSLYGQSIVIYDIGKKEIIIGGEIHKKNKTEYFLELLTKEIIFGKYNIKGLLFEVYFFIADLIHSLKEYYMSKENYEKVETNIIPQVMIHYEDERKIYDEIRLKYIQLKNLSK